jgi:ribosomal protein S18 acetylase RimI-like enzyme
MASITIPVQNQDHPHVRSLNVLRDLPIVADLIELCFSSTMDNDGQRYVNDMRRAGRDDGFLHWATHMAETTSLPLTGYVWEENNKIIGNTSLIPFRDRGKRIYLVANVATHPDYRRRGIARALTRRAMEHARKKNAATIWLHVRDDNPGAIQLYADLGFQEVARRTTWQANPDPHLPHTAAALVPNASVASAQGYSDVQIMPRHPHFWPLQQDWLRRLYPEALNWYAPLNLNALRPGFWNWFYLLLMEFDLRQWAAVSKTGDELLATLSWMPRGVRSESIYAAARDGEAGPSRAALTKLLMHARRTISNHATLSLEYPAGEMTEAIAVAGFKPRRTLIWMKV